MRNQKQKQKEGESETETERGKKQRQNQCRETERRELNLQVPLTPMTSIVLRLQNKAGRRQNFQVPRKTAKMWIENPQTIVATAEENNISRPEHSFAVAARRKF